MALVKAIVKQTTSVARVSEGADVNLKTLRDGTVTIADWIQTLSLEGKVFTLNSGIGTTAKIWGTDALDDTEFDLHVTVPASVVIIPIDLRIHFTTTGTGGQIIECCLQSGSGSVRSGGLAITPYSSNINSGNVSACTSYEACTTGTALDTNVKEIWRDGRQLAVTITTVSQIREQEIFTWQAKTAGILDIVGPSQELVIFASAKGGTGSLTLKYIELPKSAVL